MRVAIVVLILCCVGCTTSQPAASDWVAVTDDTGEYQLRLPSTMRPSSQKYFFVHGGQVWEDEQHLASLSFGYWSAESFTAAAGGRRWVKVGETNVYLVIGTDRILAWYDEDTPSYDPLVTVQNKAGGTSEELMLIALSLRKR